mmetsp:Transcript_19924/g.20253  ORF Transcript_19924/g.20253 Transcript_19924/m.20253 type:complete len:347 (+) Transcript_19924:70-1110(+)
MYVANNIVIVPVVIMVFKHHSNHHHCLLQRTSTTKTTAATAAATTISTTSALTKKNLKKKEFYTLIENELVRIVGRKFHPEISALASGNDNLTLLTFDENGTIPVLSSSSSFIGASGVVGGGTTTKTTLLHQITKLCASLPQPYLRSCLLLAAFICQNNKADQDRKLFSVHGNGKRRKCRANIDIYGGNDEDMAFGSTSVTASSFTTRRRSYGSSSIGGGSSSITTTTAGQHQQQHQVEQLKMLRLRPIPLERVFSIFVTLVKLNPTEENEDDDDNDDNNIEVTINDLGSTRLYTDISHLIDIGYLHPAMGNQIHLSTARFLCSLTRDEAIEISNRIGIPIERLLI